MVARRNWIFYCFLAFLAFLWEGPLFANAEQSTGPKQPKKLRVDTVYEPASCHKKDAKKSRKGDELKVIYSGAFYTDPDTIFDSNFAKPEPLKFTLGLGKVMPGWEQGLTKMCVGERRKLVIPADLTFNGEAAIYNVELKSLKKKAPASPGKSEL